jgi:beta-lactamase class A
MHQPNDVTRRSALALGLAALASPAWAASLHSDPIGAMERRHGGRLGVFALDLQTGRTLAHRADERFKLHSTFKGLLSALVLADVSRAAERLDAVVRFGPTDMLPASPITEAALASGRLSVGALCEAIMFRSDNTAANLLMVRRGGPARLTRYLRSLGDRVTRVDDYEGQMEGKPAIADSTTPRAIAQTFRRLGFRGALQPAERQQWKSWMTGNVVGQSRLRASFPAEWASGDRTGTADGYCNDVAFAERPGCAPLIVSAYHEAPGMELPAQEQVLRAVGAAAVAWQAA